MARDNHRKIVALYGFDIWLHIEIIESLPHVHDMYLLISIYLLALYHCTISKLQFTKLCQMMSLSNHYRLSIHGATRIVSPMVSGPANDVPEV